MISVVIPTQGRFDSLTRALESVRAQDYSGKIELIVVDDAADPPSPTLGQSVKTVRFATKRGACAARNEGAKLAQGEFLLFMDDDAVLTGVTDLTRAVAWFTANRKVGVVGFRQLMSDGRPHYMQPVDAETPVRTGLFFSYGCLVRRSAYEAVGGMNEQFGYYYEEVELSLKLFAAGYEVLYDPRIAVIHHEDSRYRDYRRIRRQSTRNAFLSYVLHYPCWMLPILFARRTLLHWQMSGYRASIISDIHWFVSELVMRRKYLAVNRRPYKYAVVRAFHGLCGVGIPVA